MGRKPLEVLVYADTPADVATNRQVAADQLAAALGEDRGPFDEGGPLLMVAGSGKSPYAVGSWAVCCGKLVCA